MPHSYFIVEITEIDCITSKPFHREFTVAFNEWVASRLRVELKDRLDNLVVEVIRFEYVSAYPVLGVRHVQGFSGPVMLDDAEELATRMLRLEPAAEMLKFASASAVSWTERVAQLGLSSPRSEVHKQADAVGLPPLLPGHQLLELPGLDRSAFCGRHVEFATAAYAWVVSNLHIEMGRRLVGAELDVVSVGHEGTHWPAVRVRQRVGDHYREPFGMLRQAAIDVLNIRPATEFARFVAASNVSWIDIAKALPKSRTKGYPET